MSQIRDTTANHSPMTPSPQFARLSPSISYCVRGVAVASKGKKGTQRKLSSILCADVVGYSRLMGADEEAEQGGELFFRAIGPGKIIDIRTQLA